MANISNEQLSNQIARLDAKIELFISLLERNEKTMFSFFGRQRDLKDNLSKISDVYSKARDELNYVYKKIDEFYNIENKVE